MLLVTQWILVCETRCIKSNEGGNGTEIFTCFYVQVVSTLKINTVQIWTEVDKWSRLKWYIRPTSKTTSVA